MAAYPSNECGRQEKKIYSIVVSIIAFENCVELKMLWQREIHFLVVNFKNYFDGILMDLSFLSFTIANKVSSSCYECYNG